MDDQLLQLLVKKFDDEIIAIQESLCDGVAQDYAHYRDLCGAIRGLRTAQRETKDLVRKLREIDDE